LRGSKIRTVSAVVAGIENVFERRGAGIEVPDGLSGAVAAIEVPDGSSIWR
jgi:hypothetical protein